jgi:hypothetical protein
MNMARREQEIYPTGIFTENVKLLVNRLAQGAQVLGSRSSG